MSIYKRKYKSGDIRWGIDYYDRAGHRIKKIVGNKKQAELAHAKIKQQQFEEEFLDKPRIEPIIFEDLLDQFLAYSEVTKKYKAYMGDKNAIDSFILLLGGKYVSQITVADIENYKIKRLQKVKPASLNRNLAILKRVFNWAEELELIDPTNNLSKKIKKVREEPGRTRYLTHKEMSKLLFVAENLPHLKTILHIALNTGARKSEIFKLTWQDIDFENNIIEIRGKTAKQEYKIRRVPMNTILKKVLLEWQKSNQTTPADLFLLSDCRRSFQSVLKKAGIKNFRFHDLRHTFASHLVMEGADLSVVSRLLGHSTLDMTMRYAHLSPDHRKRAADFMGNLTGTSALTESEELELSSEKKKSCKTHS